MQQKNDWIKSRKDLLQQVKRQVLAYLGDDPEMDAYARAYRKEFSSKWEPSGFKDLLHDVVSADIVFGGDFHAFAQSQRTHLRILRSLPMGRNLILGLECVESKHQKCIDQFLANQISEEEFLSLVRWDARWGFAWEAYKPLFDFARQKKLKVFGLNRYYRKKDFETLTQRDIHCCRQILKIRKKYPRSTIYTIYGDLHLAKSHLLAHLEDLSGDSAIKVLRIFLNSERLYFDLAKKNLEHDVEILKSAHGRYCVLSSPPWVKWQSYLMFLEQNYDAELLDEDDLDYTDQVAQFVRVMVSDLSLAVDCSDLEVYSPTSESPWDKINRVISPSEGRIIRQLIVNDRSFYLPDVNMIFLSRYSINHCATVAGFYLHAKLCQSKERFWHFPDDFLRAIWVEAGSFFLSKLVNHKRKAERMVAVKNQLKVMHPKNKGREALTLVMDQRMQELIRIHNGTPKKPLFKPKNTLSYLSAARYLGSMMGERMYRAYQGRRLDVKSVGELLQYNLSGEDFEKFYFQTVKRLEATQALAQRGLALA